MSIALKGNPYIPAVRSISFSSLGEYGVACWDSQDPDRFMYTMPFRQFDDKDAYIEWVCQQEQYDFEEAKFVLLACPMYQNVHDWPEQQQEIVQLLRNSYACRKSCCNLHAQNSC